MLRFQSPDGLFRTSPFQSRRNWLIVACTSLLAGCGGVRSALDPAGQAAEHVATLYWWMVAGSAGILILVVGLTVHAVRARRNADNERKARLLIVGGGVILPVVVLTALLVYGLAMLPEFTAPAPAGSIRMIVHGKQWWWRVRYETATGERIEWANEVRLPINEPVEFQLESYDVNHAFWIPALGGKMDLIPGRTTRLALKPTRIGVYQGVCAEYCGLSHAFMQFPVIVVSKEEFDRWLAHQAEPAAQSEDAQIMRGQGLFIASACNACHTVRGSAELGAPALSAIGPDLTHVGGRRSIAAGALPNEPEAIARWIANTRSIKPGTLMPPFSNLPQEDLRALSLYVKSLQ